MATEYFTDRTLVLTEVAKEKLQDIILEDRFTTAVRNLNPHIPEAAAIAEAIGKGDEVLAPHSFSITKDFPFILGKWCRGGISGRVR